MIVQLNAEIEKYTEKSRQIESILQNIQMNHKVDPQVLRLSDELMVLKRQIDSDRDSIKPTEKKLHSSMRSATEVRLLLQKGGNSLFNLPPDLYWNQLASYSDELAQINKMQSQIERKIANDKPLPQNEQITPSSIAETLEQQYQSMIFIADRASSTHNTVEALRKKRRASSVLGNRYSASSMAL